MTTTPLPRDLADVCCHALDRAATRVALAYENRTLEDDFALQSVRQELVAVVGTAQRWLRGQGADGEPGKQVAPFHRHRLVRLLRAGVLDEWPDQGAVGLLTVMRALEAVEPAPSDLRSEVDDGLPKALRGVLGEVGHVLRSPMGSIVMLADTLAEGRSGGVTVTQRHQLLIIHRAALGLATLAGDLLTLTDEELDAEEPEAFSVREVLTTVRDVVEPVTEARGSDLRILVDEACDSGPRLGARRLLGRALLDLALDAALQTKRGSVEVVAQHEGADKVRFSVIGTSYETPSTSVYRLLAADEEARAHRLSSGAVRRTAARRMVRELGSELERGADGARSSFLLPLRPASQD
jgi:signal transduction histidine kinase